MNTDLRKKAINKCFLSWWIKQVFIKPRKMWKHKENTKKHIKLVPNEGKGDYLVSEPSYHTTIFFWKSISSRNEKKRDTYE